MRFTPAICALLLAGCFPTRSTELACVVTQDCEEGNACTQGYCLPIQDPAGPDAAPQPDAPPAEPTCEEDWPDEPSIYSGCAFAKAPAITVGANSTFDTTNGTWTGTTGDPGRVETISGQQVRVLIVEGFTFPSGTLRVTGQHPLLVVSWGDVVINGTIDASSNAADVLDPNKRGAGANSSVCPALTPGLTNNNGGSGGGGGGFGGAGSRGGNGADVAGQPGGSVIAAPMLAGGCAGANGGLRVAGNDENQGGAGGGAVYFASRTAITGTGTIDVGGAGGQGARNDDDQNGNDDRGGGGGGGSGGFIGLEAPTISFSGVLAANGGGGGAGCDEGNGNNGADGGLTQALGAANGDQAGGSDGGNGGFNTSAATDAENFDGSAGGGGGGGGGVGHIVRKPG